MRVCFVRTRSSPRLVGPTNFPVPCPGAGTGNTICPHPLRGPTEKVKKNSSEFFGVARPQSKFHFSNLSSLMRQQVLVGASLGGLPVLISSRQLSRRRTSFGRAANPRKLKKSHCSGPGKNRRRFSRNHADSTRIDFSDAEGTLSDTRRISIPTRLFFSS